MHAHMCSVMSDSLQPMDYKPASSSVHWKNGTDEPICRAGIETQIEKTLVDTEGAGEGGMNRESIMYTLLGRSPEGGLGNPLQ